MIATSINEQEMDGFLVAQGFRPILVAGTNELIYARIVYVGPHKISQRIYTTIYHGQTLGKGVKAIKVKLFFMVNGIPKRVGDIVRCLRVKGWKKHLADAINDWQDHYKACPRCQNPMVMRRPDPDKHQTFEPFWGCVMYPNCKGK
jgi:hypothetical protein